MTFQTFLLLRAKCHKMLNCTHVFLFPQVLPNGNLVLPPFRAEDYNQEVHAQTYKCIAENTLGKIQSRDVHVRAGTDKDFESQSIWGVPLLLPNLAS